MSKVLIVDTQMVLCRTLAIRLHRRGFSPVFAAMGCGRLARALSPPPQAVVFGASIGPRLSLQASRGIRHVLGGPIVVEVPPGESRRWLRDLQSRPGVYFIESGKPALLVEKLAALLSREAGAQDGQLSCGGLRLFPRELRATCDGVPLPLTPREFDLLACLMKNAGSPVPPAALMRAVWGREDDALLHTLRSHIAALRGKLGPYRACIAAVRGAGYLFSPGRAPGQETEPNNRKIGAEQDETFDQ